VGRPLDFRSGSTAFTGADLMAILPAMRASLTQGFGSSDPTVQTIQVTKQLSGPNSGLYPTDFPESVGFPHQRGHTAAGRTRLRGER
jgi:hypothetical protein